MSREIKFRGKRVDNGEWAFGMYLISGKNHHSPNLHVIYSDENNLNQYMGLQGRTVIPETVGQFTGLTDKNGKEIYEGDILKSSMPSDFDEERVYSVGFYFGAFCFHKGTDKLPCRQWNDGSNDWYSIENIESYLSEVIGNIHDNKSLCQQ